MFLTTLHEHHEVKTLDEFLDHFRRLLKERIVGANRYLGRWMLERSRNGSESMRVACLVNDCLARGKAVDEGGARYNQTEPNFPRHGERRRQLSRSRCAGVQIT